MEDYLRIGVITKPHGLRGEMSVFPTTDDPERFEKLGDVYLEGNGSRIIFSVKKARLHKNMVLVKLAGIDTIEQAMTLSGMNILVKREDGVPLESGEYYIADLIGMEAVAENGETIGKIRDVLGTGANDVYIIDTPSGKELLIPAIKECVVSVDTEKSRMVLRVPAGLD